MIGFNKTFGIALMAVCLPTHCFSESINSNIDFISLSHKIGWRAWASWFRNAKDNDLIPVLKKSYLDDSIFQIIAKGISDCVYRKGVFSDENRKVNTKEQLVFVDFNADPKSFKQEEWNVVLLYNYLDNSMHASNNEFTTYEDFYDPRIVTDAQKRLSDVKERLLKIYKDEVINNTRLVNYLNTAYRVINDYAKSLRLYQYIHEYKKIRKQQPGRPKFSPNTIGWNYNKTTKSGQFRLQNARIELEGKETPANLDVVVEDGKIVRYKIWDTTNKFDNDENLIGKFKTFKENFKLDKDFIDKQFKDKLLKKQQIHNLCNYYDDKMNTPSIVQDKCYLNSCIQALHASATVRENVNKLSKKQGILRNPNYEQKNNLAMIDISPVLKQIFDAIENGGMEKYIKGQDTRQNLKCYQTAMSKLADCLERSEAWRCAKTSLMGSEENQQSLLARYQQLLQNNNFKLEMEDGKDYKLFGHRIRNAGVNDTNIMAQEITHALAIEADDKNEEPIAPVKLLVKPTNNPNTIFIDKLGSFNNILDTIVIRSQGQEVLPKKQTKNEELLLNSSINGNIIPHVDPLIIQPISYNIEGNNPKIRDQKVYSEITRIVHGKQHRYRLIANVLFPNYGGHYRASILTQDGWVMIDDIDNKETASSIRDYDENQGKAWGHNRSLVIYEPVY